MNNDGIAFLQRLEDVINDRTANPEPGSYTASLITAGAERIAQKVGEEGVELAIASLASDSDAIKSEAADLLYHLLVLLANRGLRLADVVAVLEDRHAGKSGAAS